MNLSLKKVKIMFQKDMVDLFNNPNVLVVCLIPVIFGILYSKLGILGDQVLFMISIMNMSMVPLMLSSTTIAEEKEKYTLRTLMLSNISAGEFLLAKAIMSIVILDLIGIIMFLTSNNDMKYLIGYVLITTFCSIPIILLGCAIGIISRDQMTAGLYQLPVMLVIMLPVMLAPINKTIANIANLVPTNSYVNMFTRYFKGNLFDSKMIADFAVVIVWILVTTGGFYVIYKKNSIDN